MAQHWKQSWSSNYGSSVQLTMIHPLIIIMSYKYTKWHQFSSVVQSCPTLCDPMDYNTPGLLSITNSQSLLKFMSIESVMTSNHLILCYPLLLPLSIFPSILVFSNESHQVVKVLEFQLQHQSFQWTHKIHSFKMDCLDLLAVQGTLKSLLQHHSSKASILGAQLSL